jgi:hypothetical protein
VIGQPHYQPASYRTLLKGGYPASGNSELLALARIDAVLKRKPREYRTDFIAEAVERELRRRERKPPKPRAKP